MQECESEVSYRKIFIFAPLLEVYHWQGEYADIQVSWRDKIAANKKPLSHIFGVGYILSVICLDGSLGNLRDFGGHPYHHKSEAK